MPASRVNGFTVGYTAVGAIVLWSGIKGSSISGTFQSLLAGKAPTASSSEEISPGATLDTSTTSTSAAPGDTGASSASAAANQAIAKVLAAPYGWSTGTEWEDLVSLWNRESGWSNTAQNPTSGAYGIPQALPYTKMPKAAWPPADGGSASASSQISWGLSYIKATYGDPEAAWAHEESNGWY